ncbi:MAG: metallophosphoesterase, partial [Oscillospiraceae bacterium]|nr:metallophosphoesterase [Oscillospiraceae bacterium]
MMKKIYRKVLVLLLTALMLLPLLCVPRGQVRAALSPDTAKDGKLRVLLTSDIHYCTTAYYGVAGKDRLQLWVDSINAEHKREPLDLIIIAGDMSLDHYYSNGTIFGSYMGTNKVSYTEKFVKEYVSQLPAGVPRFFIPGNHEQYSDTQWKSITGNNRQCSYRIEGNLFLMLDNFNTYLEPNATANAVYTPSDMDFIQSEMAKYPDDKVWLIAHYFEANLESEAFKRLVQENDRIMGLFGGHDHMGDVKNTTTWGTKPYSMCGTFALSGTVTPEHSAGQPQRFGYEAKTLTAEQQASLDASINNFWGFRELKITPEKAESNYISVDTGNTAPYFYGRKIDLPRTLKYHADYAATGATAGWGPAADGIYYIGSTGDMKAFSKLGQTFDFAGKTVKLTRDIDMSGVNWTMIPQFAGTLDGCGRAIKNLNLYANAGTLAMIDRLQDGTIRNLRMVGGSVKLVGSHSAAGIAVRANGTCLFSNVYCKMNVSVDSDCYRAGGFLAFPERANLTFENCVSECTISGMRGGGFVAQVNYNTYSTVFKDCAFIGDLSGSGRLSGGIVGLCAGNVTMERCVSLGKQSPNAESGGMIFIDHQNQSETAETAVHMKDCYAAVDTQLPIGTQAARSFRLKFTLEYTGKTPYTVNTSANDLLASHQSELQKNFGYLAKGSTVHLTTSNLRTLCPTLTGWSGVSGTVSYGTEKTVPKILPTATWDLISGKSIAAVPSAICALCGGNTKPYENLGNGTHLIACDRMTHSIQPHSFTNGKCACGQRECPYLLVDFLPMSVMNEATDWVPTQRDTGMATVAVDHNNKGTMDGTVQYRDAYVSMARAMDKTYPIQKGDVIEIRMKGTVTAGSCSKSCVYFTTEQQTGYSETHKLDHTVSFDGSYQTVSLGSLDAYVGQTIRTLRIDMFQHASADFAGSYSLDYIYVGPANLAPSQGSRALYFDFSDDEHSVQRYSTSTYRGYNYDVADNWRKGEAGAQPAVRDGKLCFDLTQRYNASNEPVYITALEPVGTVKTFSWGNDNKYANDLAYDPSKAEVIQLRLRLTDVQHYYPNSTKRYLRLFYLPEGATEWSCGTAPNDWAESILLPIEDQYMDGGEKEGQFFTLGLSLKGKKFSTYESIRGIMLNFLGMRGGRVEIDYLYIGPAPTDRLLFDFNGTGKDRYDTVSYGILNYDQTDHWYHEADVSAVSIESGKLNLTMAATAKNDHSQYIETSKIGNRSADPLHFTPKSGDVIQLRYSLVSYDATANSGKTPSITIYGWDSGKGGTNYLGTSWETVNTDKVGTYVTKTWTIPSGWTEYDVTRLRITLRGLLNSKVAVEHLYVGPGCTAPEAIHSYSYEATKNPTISATGALTGTCSRCSGTITVTLPKLNTTDYTKTTTAAATCTATGVDKYTWKTTTYGSFSFNATTAALGHSYTEKVTAPTCTAQGYTTHTCSRCSHSYKDTYTNALGHNYTNYKATKAPTTSATGVLTGTCSRCSATTTVTLPKLNTTDYTKTTTTAAICTATGVDKYTWKTTTYGSFSFNATTAALGHSYTNKVTAPTCTAQGYTTHTCSRCSHSYKDTYTNALGHNYTGYKATKNPTTSATGVLTGTCSRCSATTTVTLPKLNTTDYTKTTTTAATCTATGVDKYTWKTTTYGSFSFNATTAALGHSYTNKVTAPTCTAQGYTTHTCSRCSNSYKDTYTNALGHNYTNYKATTAPTTSATGILTGTCSRCSATTTVTLPKLNTTDYTKTTTTAATCTATGVDKYTWKTTTYGTFSFNATTAALGHSYTNKVTAPTCTAQGYTTHTCSRCSHSYKDTYTAALGHSYTNYKATTNPTTSATGILTGTCSRCSATT